MMAVYNRLDAYAEQLDSSIVVVHHLSKGDQTGKVLTDLDAGAGSINRAADTILTIMPHEKDGNCVLECETRSFKSPGPVTIKFNWPLWDATTLPPERRGHARGQTKQQRDDAESITAIRKILESGNHRRSIDGGNILDRRMCRLGLYGFADKICGPSY